MAGGKRKVFNRKTRSKRQSETENTGENPPAKSLRGSSCQGKKPKFEEKANEDEKRPLSVQVDITTKTEPTTSMQPKSKDDDASKKVSKYVPPFSRTRNSGNQEEESGSKSPVTRSSTRKRNLLHALADVARQKLEFQDRSDETSSLGVSEKEAEICPSNDDVREQERTLETPPAKQPKLRERIRINRHFSLNLKGKGKRKAKLNESRMEKEEKIDRNAVIAETLGEDEGKDTTGVEIHDEKEHHQISGEKSKDKTKEDESDQQRKKINGNAAMAETLGENEKHEIKHYKTAEEVMKGESSKCPSYHVSDGSDGTDHSECGRGNEMRPKKGNPSDSMIKDTKMLYKDAVVKACVDYLIQAVEEGISVDVVGSDNNLVLDPFTKKKGHVDEGLPIQQQEIDDHCTKVYGDHQDEQSTNSVDIDQTSLEINEAMMPRSSELDHSDIKVFGDYRDENSILKTTDVVGVDDENDKEGFSNEMYDGSKTAHSSDIDVVVVDDENDKEGFSNEMYDGSKTAHSSDIDVVGDGDESDKEGFSNEMHDGNKTAHSSDIDVVGDGENNEEVLGGELECQEDIDFGDIDGNISVKKLRDEEVHTGSKAHLSDDANVPGDDVITIKNHGGYEMHANNRADLDDVDVVGYDDQHTAVSNLLQPELTANAGEVGNVEYLGRNAKDGNIANDIDTATNFNKENHVIMNLGNADHISPKTSNEARKSSFKDTTATDTCCYTAGSQMHVLPGTLSTDGKIMPMKGASLEELEVSEVECVKMLPDTLDKDTNKGHGNQEKSEQEKRGKQYKALIIPEKESSAVNKECSASGTAWSKCGGEMDLDYVMDCTDSQLIGAKPNVSDGFRYDDFNLEDLMDCTDSQLVDIENQVLDHQQSAKDRVSQGLMIEDGTAVIQDLIKEMSSIKLYLMDAWNRCEQVKKKKHLAHTPVIKKWK